MSTGEVITLVDARTVSQDTNFHGVSNIRGSMLIAPAITLKKGVESEHIVASRILASRPWGQLIHMITGTSPSTQASVNAAISASCDSNALRAYQAKFCSFSPENDQKNLRVARNVLNSDDSPKISGIWSGNWYGITNCSNVVQQGRGNIGYKTGPGNVYTLNEFGETPNGNMGAALLARAKLDVALPDGIPVGLVRGHGPAERLFPIRTALMLQAGKAVLKGRDNITTSGLNQACRETGIMIGAKDDFGLALLSLGRTGLVKRGEVDTSNLTLDSRLGDIREVLMEAITCYHRLVNTPDGQQEIIENFNGPFLATNKNATRVGYVQRALVSLFKGPTENGYY
jgi:hypothetical protein